jgi:5-methylcytosine-specific restriction endonuclease McrA
VSIADRLKLPNLQDRPRCAPQKGMPHQLVKKADDKKKADRGKAFRDEVWARDHGVCRATGRTLLRTGTTDWEKLGEVDHSVPRSLAPERIYDTSNGLLLTKSLNRLRKVPCPGAPEHRMFDYTGPENRALPQKFTWRATDGRITKESSG